MEELIAFRQQIHKNPELSGEEHQTRDQIIEKILPFGPDHVVKLGDTGIAFVFKGSETGPTLMFRSELDALPITEESNVPYRSINEGVGHLCGHDGHMSILVGLAERIKANKPHKGRVILLFQPAEETGQGAVEVINSPAFSEIKPDFIFALHNIPGEPMGEVILRKNNFCAASRGLTVKLKGKTAHAAHPEQAISPAMAISRIIAEVDRINKNEEVFNSLSFATVINVKLGEIAFGTTPGYGEVRLTLRSFTDEDMETLCKAIEGMLHNVIYGEKLEMSFSYSEIFPTIYNEDKAVDTIRETAEELGLNIQDRKEPFRWSEDFGYYSQICAAGFFGLGSGKDQPALHHPDYDFPDELLETGINLFYTIYQKLIIQK